MLTWYQGNFTRVLNKLASSEVIPGKMTGEEHTLDFSYKIQEKMAKDSKLKALKEN
jgi:hypothetical protein